MGEAETMSKQNAVQLAMATLGTVRSFMASKEAIRYLSVELS